MNQPMIDGLIDVSHNPTTFPLDFYLLGGVKASMRKCPGHISSPHENHRLNSRPLALSKCPLCQAVLTSGMFILK